MPSSQCSACVSLEPVHWGFGIDESLVIWSLSVAKGVGPVFHTGQNTSRSNWSLSWLLMSSIGSTIGSTTAGMTNGSDFSRYARNKTSYVVATIFSVLGIGSLVSFTGLVITAACQKIYGDIYWNPPDLLMVMMDNGNGSSRSRAAVFFLSLGFALPVRIIF
jgi:NCS1 family nucleobase:cation symporter-1